MCDESAEKGRTSLGDELENARDSTFRRCSPTVLGDVDGFPFDGGPRRCIGQTCATTEPNYCW